MLQSSHLQGYFGSLRAQPVALQLCCEKEGKQEKQGANKKEDP